MASPTGTYLGLSGLPGVARHATEHILQYAPEHAQIGVALGDIGHCAAAVVVEDGAPVYAVEEERLTRFKKIMSLPLMAVDSAFQAIGGAWDSVDVSFYINPSEGNMQRRVQGCMPFLDESGAAEMAREYRASAARFYRELTCWPKGLNHVDHHMAHAASTFYLSGFDRALVLVTDGGGECFSTSVMVGDENGLRPVAEYPFASSLGLLYGNLTAYLGFDAASDEYKVMGLAAYGKDDAFRGFFDSVIQYDDTGGFYIPDLLLPPRRRLYRWVRALGPPRRKDEPITDRHVALAHSLQSALERTVLRLLEHYAEEHGARYLCLAGGVALNCTMNGLIDRSGLFDEIFVQPAAGDEGAALGSALLSYHSTAPQPQRTRMEHVYLGPAFSEAEVKQALDENAGSIDWTYPANLFEQVAGLLARGKVVAWFQGAMEFGPRALGNRSILADPRDASMKDRVNSLVKHRESFRPFAPSVTREAADAFFQLRTRRQYEFMTIAVPARPERAAEIPAVVHEGTSRIHIVRKEINPRYWTLIDTFGKLTGVPVVLNTSFNVKGEPIVASPRDAIKCFLNTGIDVLVLEDILVSKKGLNRGSSNDGQ